MSSVHWVYWGQVINGSTPTLAFPMVDAADGHTAETGKTLVETYSINEAAFTAAANTHGEIANGVYTHAIAAAESATDGTLVYRFTNADCRDTFVLCEVVSGDQDSCPQVNVAYSDVLTGYSLSAAGLDAIWDEVQEAGATDITARQVMRAIIAQLTGTTDGGGTSTLNIDNYNDTKTVLSYTVDSEGDRSAVTVDLD